MTSVTCASGVLLPDLFVVRRRSDIALFPYRPVALHRMCGIRRWKETSEYYILAIRRVVSLVATTNEDYVVPAAVTVTTTVEPEQWHCN